MESPYKCVKCGNPANSPLYRHYCWDCYYKYTDGKPFGPTLPPAADREAGKDE